MDACEICGAEGELRRKRCWGCYNRWVENRPVGLGASCVMCGDRRRDCLKQVELLRAWMPLCHNCAARTAEIHPLPQSIAAIRSLLGRERRRVERRVGRPDTRIFPRERRGLERRSSGSLPEGDLLPIDDDDIILVEDDLIYEEPIPGDETRIVELLKAPG